MNTNFYFLIFFFIEADAFVISIPEILNVLEYKKVVVFCNLTIDNTETIPEFKYFWTKSPDFQIPGDILLIPEVRFTDSGEYVCRAIANGINVKSNTMLLNVLYFPRWHFGFAKKSAASIGSVASLNCYVEGNPVPNIIWYSAQFKKINSNEKTSIAIIENISQLQIKNVENSDYGVYICFANNSLANMNFSINLQKPGKPDAPQSCQLLNASDYSIFFICIPGFDGGSKNLKFFVRAISKNILVEKFFLASTDPILLKDLLAGNQYSVEVFVENEYGRSDESTSFASLTSGTENHILSPPTAIINKDAIIGGVIGTILVIILIIGIISGCYIWRNKKDRLIESSSNEEEHTETNNKLLSSYSNKSFIENEMNYPNERLIRPNSEKKEFKSKEGNLYCDNAKTNAGISIAKSKLNFACFNATQYQTGGNLSSSNISHINQNVNFSESIQTANIAGHGALNIKMADLFIHSIPTNDSKYPSKELQLCSSDLNYRVYKGVQTNYKIDPNDRSRINGNLSSDGRSIISRHEDTHSTVLNTSDNSSIGYVGRKIIEDNRHNDALIKGELGGAKNYKKHMKKTNVPNIPAIIDEESNQNNESNNLLQIPREKLYIRHKIGEGKFGEVWAAKIDGIYFGMSGSQPVAVKMLKDNYTDDAELLIRSELELLKMASNQINIVKLLGCCISSNPICLIMELVTTGNLLDFIQSYRNVNDRTSLNHSDWMNRSLRASKIKLCLRDLVNFGLQIASAMEYVASFNMMQRYLCCKHILIDSNQVCKIADFIKSSDLVIWSQLIQIDEMNCRWYSPETITNFSDLSIHSNVWSFGVLLWELITLGSTPFSEYELKKDVINYVWEGGRLPLPKHCPHELFSLMQQCWSVMLLSRPSFKSIHRKIKNILKSDTIDMNIYLTELTANHYKIIQPLNASIV